MSKTKIERYRGDTYPLEVVLDIDGAPVDMTSIVNTAKFSYIKGKTKKTIDGINGSTNGEISFPFPAEINAGVYIYDIQVINADGQIRTYVKDEMIIEDDVTK